MTFSIIGTGNIAWFFGSRIGASKHRCTGVYSRNVDAAKSLAEMLLCERYGGINEIEDGRADVCFLAVSDAAIPEVAARLSLKQTVLVHTAGAVSLDAVKKAAKDTAVLWPIYSILKSNPPGHRNIPCAWEASSPKAKRYVQEMGHAITDLLFETQYEQRKWLHLCAVMSNNFVNHLLAICEQVCVENGLPFATLLPIINQTFDRIQHGSPTQLQTGPAVRNDTTTLSAQTELLAGHPAWQQVYDAITHSIQANNKH